MKNRNSSLLALRPKILKANVSEFTSDDEKFQNITIRPIIKLQNDLLLAVFRNYVHKRKNTFYDLNLEGRMTYIDNAINRDMKFRNNLKGMIIGQFTVDEYQVYIKNSSALNKRIMNIVKERLLSNIQLLDKNIAS